MKKKIMPAFPLLFALPTLVLFVFLYRPAAHSPAMTSACLVFLTALGWSALIVFGGREMQVLKVVYAAGALLASLLLVGLRRPFPIDPLQHSLMVVLQALGMAGIILYLRILKRKEEKSHE
ncbi:MAG: hypothetical protein JXO51_08245 [Candidatus Aminicenantes bacterium]|nr:hypothetical protein [Candidatus Aminicenantes bacterium]